MVDATNFKLPLASRKMGPRRLGPFKISRQVNEVAFEVELPPKSRVHPVFHVSQLRKFLGSAPPPADPIMSGNPGKNEYEVESILDCRVFCKQRKYLVKWIGYPIEEASWEPAVNLENFPGAMADFFPCRPDIAGGDVTVLKCISLKRMHKY